MRRRRLGGTGVAACTVVLVWVLLSAWILTLSLPGEARLSTFDPDRTAVPVEPDLSVVASDLAAHRDVPDSSSFALFADDLRMADGVVVATGIEILEKGTPEPVRVAARRGAAPLVQDPILGGWTLGEIVLSGSPEARLPRGLSVGAERLRFDANAQVVWSEGPAMVHLAGQAEPIHTDRFVYDLRRPRLILSVGAMREMSRVLDASDGEEPQQ